MHFLKLVKTTMLKTKHILLCLLVLIISIIIASRFPIGNDEAYYIAFARNLQLSYIDAPPFVAYLNVIQLKLGLLHPLQNRIFVVILHLISTLLLLLVVKNNLINPNNNPQSVFNLQKTTPDNLSEKLLITFLIAYLVPIFGLYGVLILPDSGLILGLSIMLYISDIIARNKYISITNITLLGIGLGIGLLSKYHILPLGGGMLLGLYIDIVIQTKRGCIKNLIKLSLSVIIGVFIALPLFIWNCNNHYASFIFQLQHGFSSNNWQVLSMLGFLLGVLLYMTPWFTYILIKKGLFVRMRYYLVIPVFGLFTILIMSSLRKNILPHWIAPAFWLLIPYAVVYTNNLRLLKIMCKYTSILWLILLFILLLPEGMSNFKKVNKIFNPDTTGLADLLLWSELPKLFDNNQKLQHSLATYNLVKSSNCMNKKPIIGTIRWYWAAQLEYHQVFGDNYQILNLDLRSSNFYMWRDNLVALANCPILIIADSRSINIADINSLVTIKNQYDINGIGDYKSLRLVVIQATLNSANKLRQKQNDILNSTHY